MAVTVRYFAGAAEAAGCEEERVEAASLGELRSVLLGRHGPALARVLPRCAVLVAGERGGDDLPVPEGAVIDVLPPFAGG